MKIKERGSFNNIEKFLDNDKYGKIDSILAKYGQMGCEALEKATPKRTGLTSRSWIYKIRHEGGKTYLEWHNTNIQNKENIAVLIQYGFVTSGGYLVQGRDYINPALTPIYDELEKELKGEN